ncbi:cutinase family protein [Mycolicibacterium sp. ND9-15]|nr:cutinase family protein [Mycolicibacterium sp. ND9-15]WSE58712.1 cutinase family protein [Mycolicibacterium sp. ND9-15]
MTALGLTFPLLPPAAASAQGCSDVTVVFARGTGEPPGIGRVGQAFVDALRTQLADRTLSAYGVTYPASYDFALAADGAADAAAYVANTAQSCPDSRIVLGGFSQGAAVVDMLAGVPPLGNRLGAVGQVLPPNVAPNVAAVAVFGNPATKFGNPITSAPVFGGRAIDLCTDGDPICSRGRNPFAHSDYVGAGMASHAANFVARLV